MSDIDSRKRKFWRFHLLTAVLIALSSCLFIYANFSERKHWGPQFDKGIQRRYGWPLVAKTDSFTGFGGPTKWSDWFPIAVVVDALVAISITFSLAVAFEWLIRKVIASSAIRKPGFWRVHLLTAVVALLTAGWMLHLNCRTSQKVKMRIDNDFCWMIDGPGWPFHQVEVCQNASSDEITTPHFGAYIFENLIVNVLILLLLIVVCEYLIRRREARKA